MDDIRDIVQAVVRATSRGGVAVSDVLAAFIARTVVESDASSFALDRPLTNTQKEEVILRTVERLLQKDDPSLEMIKMQVDFDTVFLEQDAEAQAKLKSRAKMIATHRQAIAEVRMADSQDYEALTTLYRKMFRFLLEFAPNSSVADKPMEREVAAAMESVSPRVGLKTFIQHPHEEKMSQLMQMAAVILGIRLYNRDEGQGRPGGSTATTGQSSNGMDHMERDSSMLATQLVNELEMDVENFTDGVQKYQRAIIRAHVYRRKKKFVEREAAAAAAAVAAGGEDGTDIEAAEAAAEAVRVSHGLREKRTFMVSKFDDLNDQVVERWSAELANRRQYLSFARLLLDDARFTKQKVISLAEKISTELSTLRSMLTNKASIPKEIVYPHFEVLGTTWLQLYEEAVMLMARSNTYFTLKKYRLSFSPTLADEFYAENGEVENLSQALEESHRQLGDVDAPLVVAEGPVDTESDAKLLPAEIQETDGGHPPADAKEAFVQSTDEKNGSGENEDKDGESKSEDKDGESKSEDKDGESKSEDKDGESKSEFKDGLDSKSTDAKDESVSNGEDVYTSDAKEDTEGSLHADSKSRPESAILQQNSRPISASSGVGEDQKTSSMTPNFSSTPRPISPPDGKSPQYDCAPGVELMTIENTPDFTQLPLELQGFCPWTMVEAQGLLVPGKPTLGIVRYHNHFFVCDHELAITAFMRNPDLYLDRIRQMALRSPEYIHLLRLQRWFPTASIARLLERSEVDMSAITGQPMRKDAATETPTHFVESHINLQYHWNQWELRRRALKMIDLSQSVTRSQQTDSSHFRRDNNSQVYLPRTQTTQTRKDQGTNPPIVTTYIQGLRGKTYTRVDSTPSSSTSVSRRGSESKQDSTDPMEVRPKRIVHPKCGVVSLTLDL